MPDAVISSVVQHYPPGARQQPHAHETTQVSVLLRGRVDEAALGTSRVGTPFSVCVKKAGLVHADRFGPEGATVLRLDLPAEYDVPRWTWVGAGRPARYLFKVYRGGPDAEFALNDLVSSLDGEAHETGEAPGFLRRTLEAVWESPDEIGSVEALAREAGVHPVYLSRCSVRWTGHGISTWMQLARLRKAAELIGPDRSLAEVAHSVGFSDQAHFNRQFRKHFGTTPGWFRRILAG